MSASETGPVRKDDIEAARQTIAPFLFLTDVRELGGVHVKLENTQHIGSFEYRGAVHLLLNRHAPGEPVVVASAGWFGMAIALAARELTIEATVFVPSSTEFAVLESLRANGATVEVVDGDFNQAERASRGFAAEIGARFGPFDAKEVLAGYGTIGPELEDQFGQVDTVVVPAGLGLAAGLAAWFGERAKIVTVNAGQARVHPTLDGDKPMVRIDIPTSHAVRAMWELWIGGSPTPGPSTGSPMRPFCWATTSPTRRSASSWFFPETRRSSEAHVAGPGYVSGVQEEGE